MTRKKKVTDIPLHRLTETTDTGFFMRRVELVNPKDQSHVRDAHRDDHFLFLVQETGRSILTLDFEEITAEGPIVFYILPGQVHHFRLGEQLGGWFLALDNLLLGDFRTAFESQQFTQEPLQIQGEQLQQMQMILQLMYHWYQQHDRACYREPMVRNLLASFAGMVAAAYTDKEDRLQQTHSRPVLITREFKRLVSIHYREKKQPAAYAAAMHLSLSYLNEVVKASTGSPVTYWIQYEIMLEARRLLYYSDLSVKEIAHKIGYEDHTYFSRLFHKITQMTPLQFRRQYRE